MAKAAIATVVKDEIQYIEDFIKYHLDLGVNEIFIYEDYGSLSHKEITDKYENVYLSSVLDLFDTEEEKEEVIQMRIEKIPSQTLFINKMLAKLHPTHNDYFVFLTDIDEFITCSEPFPDILDKYKDFEAILLFWQNYGCSGHLYKPIYDKPIWEIYTEKCLYEQYSDQKYWKITKFAVNMSKWKPTMKYACHNASVNWVKVDSTYKRTQPVFSPLYLRHYITKSAEEYCWKVWVRGMFHTGHRQWRSLWEMCPEMKEKVMNDKNFQKYIFDKYGVNIDF